MTNTNQLQSVLFFDGQGTFIDCGSNIDLRETSFTIEFWAKRNTVNQTDLVVEQGSITGGHELHVGFRNNNMFTLAFFGDDLNTTDRYTDGNWHHWSCLYDRDRQHQGIVYDGNLIATRDSGIYQGSGNFYIGSRQGTQDFFDGVITELRLWNDIRTASEIQSNMNERLTGKEKGLIAYWPLDEGEGNLAKDRAKNGHNGTIASPTWKQMEVPIQPASHKESLGTGLQDYAYWYRWKQSLPQSSDSESFRRGRIWS
ncbi:LamG-like jellyroll fold domain-containing protein [Oxynema aestuarii]|jgi:cyanobactin cluster PatC/TenC/TruC protein|uniref:Cyanobactin biosynthesis PatC/TenC/TruC family protein n=1 Tax=Oxynema aestuarii AP17 TaxID=2064643 RepID=A0A6H1U5S8_9CYAN|nr:LamG-like jellyroll fold domain-containing protein [Oxynema aestuarii]QIZ73727.1 cyanobactin biosynthesis PatC/TenC/TruC family protein [Oxynema aestuarii AP17]RMH73402.1 MAG: cyanobactin biosynthesis PatC/TenC/TruC family protein [Cyanobacteria bacterium J007]